jgi:DNA repair exonuclease SbcCD nuclease subunit
MKIAIVTDIHIGGRGDSQVFADFQEKFFLEVFFPYLDEHNITTVFDLGDTFDRRKYINYVSLQRGKKFLFDQLAQRNIDFHALIGNHDTYYTNTNDVNSMQLLLQEYPNFNLYEDVASEIELGSTKFLMLPWINKQNTKENLEIIENSKADVVMGHLEVQGMEMMRGMLCSHGIDKGVFSHFENVYSGHFHHPSRYGNIEYLGAPYEMTWSDYQGSRGFHVFDTETREMIKIENPHRLFYKIDYDDEDLTIDDVASLDTDVLKDTYIKVIVKNRTNAYIYDLFMNRLNDVAVDVKAIDDALNLESAGVEDILDETKDTKEILYNYIDSLETNVDTKDIKEVVDELYQEALSL